MISQGCYLAECQWLTLGQVDSDTESLEYTFSSDGLHLVKYTEWPFAQLSTLTVDGVAFQTGAIIVGGQATQKLNFNNLVR